MTADQFEARVQKLVEEARQADTSDEMMIDLLHDIAETLRERLEDLGPGQARPAEAILRNNGMDTVGSPDVVDDSRE